MFKGGLLLPRLLRSDHNEYVRLHQVHLTERRTGCLGCTAISHIPDCENMRQRGVRDLQRVQNLDES